MATTAIFFDRALLDRYESDADVPARAIEGLSRSDLIWKPDAKVIPTLGAWSIQQLIVHLMDSHVIAAWRMRRIIAEDNPTIMAYDETAYANHLNYESTDVHAAAEVFRLVQRMNAQLLRQQPDSAFARTGRHSEDGVITLGSLVPIYVRHVEHHMKFLRARREALGKPLGW